MYTSKTLRSFAGRLGVQSVGVGFLGLSLAGLILTLGAAAVVVQPAALAAQTRGATQRIVQGKVQDKDGAGLKGAVVYLKDEHTSSVKTSITDDDGSYRFGQLSQNTDYELWAELGGKKSGNKSISSFDSKNSFTINLKIDK
ncbi:Carboxypeptidase regulatory-like domain-containing protein [Granulicella rosea]|uniref:Carboxypeptidase regulatory-like domain-containing protein n=1 Tax=Granulicella rosea TaxID=474952 RepID=A0A239LS98_9BACT|nr:carboxypeptidase-like regulatory domain-containing protein [Granulicella rosea]SNT32683.1 Carboxypeptidase regulatory-like domain-containing protein [Granulicella rosea]